MHRLGVLIGVLILWPANAFTVRAEEKAEERKEAFQKIQKEYQKALEEGFKAYRAAKTDEERKTAQANFPKDEDYAPKVLKLVEADPKSGESLEMLVWLVRSIRPEDTKTYDLLAKNFAADKKITPLCQMLMSSAPAGAKSFLKAVLDANEDRNTKGYACFALANLEHTQAEKAGKADADKEAEQLFRRVVKEFGEVKLGRRTLAQSAEGMIREITTLAIGMKAPNVEGKNLDDKSVKIDDFKGKVVVLDIWATWCGPCRAMIPHERAMVEKLKDKPFKLVSISADQKKETLEKFLETEKMPWDHWWDGPEGEVLKTYNVRFFPTLYVLDAKGVIRYKNIREKELETAVKKLLDETGSK